MNNRAMTLGAMLSIIGAATLFALTRPPVLDPPILTTPPDVFGCERVGSSATIDELYGRVLPEGVVDAARSCQRYYDLDWEGPHTFGRPPKQDCG